MNKGSKNSKKEPDIQVTIYLLDWKEQRIDDNNYPVCNNHQTEF